MRRRGRRSDDLCRVPSAKRGVGRRRPLRKALEVIETRCSDDISSPPRCRRPTPPTPAVAEIRSLRSRIEGEERLWSYPPRALRDVSIVVGRCVRICPCVCVANVCARAPASSQGVSDRLSHTRRDSSCGIT